MLDIYLENYIVCRLEVLWIFFKFQSIKNTCLMLNNTSVFGYISKILAKQHSRWSMHGRNVRWVRPSCCAIHLQISQIPCSTIQINSQFSTWKWLLLLPWRRCDSVHRKQRMFWKHAEKKCYCLWFIAHLYSHSKLLLTQTHLLKYGHLQTNMAVDVHRSTEV